MKQTNVFLPDRDLTGHAGRGAGPRMANGSGLLARVMLYTSREPDVMCAAASDWVGIGRVVFGMSEHQLKQSTGDHSGNPTLDLACGFVFAAGQRKVEVVGRFLSEEAAAIPVGAWG